MYIYIYIYIYVYIYISLYIYLYTHQYIYIPTSISTYLSTYLSIHIYIYISFYLSISISISSILLLCQAGTDFVPAAWRHVADYDQATASIVTHVEARSEQVVTVPAEGGGGRSEI